MENKYAINQTVNVIVKEDGRIIVTEYTPYVNKDGRFGIDKYESVYNKNSARALIELLKQAIECAEELEEE